MSTNKELAAYYRSGGGGGGGGLSQRNAIESQLSTYGVYTPEDALRRIRELMYANNILIKLPATTYTPEVSSFHEYPSLLAAAYIPEAKRKSILLLIK